MSSNVFISYRRPWGIGSRKTARKLSFALSSRWSEDGEVIIDILHVSDTTEFAKRLVNEGLNKCVAVIAIIDSYWLDPRSSSRLGATDDWITFEVSYGFEHNLLVLLLCDRQSKDRLQGMTLPGRLDQLKHSPWFEWKHDSDIEEQVGRLVGFLRRKLAGHRRLPSRLQASAQHSRSTELSMTEAEERLRDRSLVYKGLKLADALGALTKWIAVFIALWGVLVMLENFWHGLEMEAFATVLFLLALFARRQRARYLERTLTSAARRWR